MGYGLALVVDFKEVLKVDQVSQSEKEKSNKSRLPVLSERDSLNRRQKWMLGFLFSTSRFLGGYRTRLVESLEVLKKGLATETDQTKVMLDLYMKQIRGQASKEEMRMANKQLKDVFKGVGLGILLVLPFAPITLPFVVKLGEKLGVDVLPDSFRKD